MSQLDLGNPSTHQLRLKRFCITQISPSLAVHHNTKSWVQEPARSTIAGFVLTVVNYEAAVQALKKRYGKDIAIQRAHVNDLLNMPPVYSDQDIPRFRKHYSLNLPPEQERLRQRPRKPECEFYRFFHQGRAKFDVTHQCRILYCMNHLSSLPLLFHQDKCSYSFHTLQQKFEEINIKRFL